MMLSCKELVRVLNEEKELPFFKRAEVRMHLLMCKHCSSYAKHLRMMRDGFKSLFGRLTQVDPTKIQQIEKKIIEDSTRQPKDS